LLKRIKLKGSILKMMAAGIFVFTGIALYYLFSMPPAGFSDIAHSFSHLLKTNLHPLAFVGAMIVLPLVGFPISFFLVLIGFRFGILEGMLITFFILPVHMTLCYVVTHSFLRLVVINFLTRKGYSFRLFRIQRPGLNMLGFLLLPGPPYILKTYILALTDLPFVSFLSLNWATECLMTLPIVAMTGAAKEKNWIFFGAALIVFCTSLVIRWIKKRKI